MSTIQDAREGSEGMAVVAKMYGIDPMRAAVANAITTAELYPDVEAKVVCVNPQDGLAVAMLLAKMHRIGSGTHIDTEKRTLEFANGSCVRVVYEPNKEQD